MSDRSQPRTVISRIEVPFRTIVKVILTLAVLWLLARLWSILLLLFIAVLLAAAIYPAVRRLERVGLPRTAAVAVVFVGLLVAIAGILGLLIPPLIDEGRAFAAELPNYVNDAERILERNPDIQQRLQEAAEGGAADPSTIFGGFLTVGEGLVSGISNSLILLVLTIYILVDGERIYDWLVRYLPPDQRDKLDRAIPEVSRVVSGYVVGQLLTSAIFGVFTFTVLTILDVPQALFLAIIAAFADAIPIAGVFIATIPAVLLALTVSITTAVIVLVAYIAYQQVENYVIVPRVYKNTLQISSFAVLIAVLIGAQLLGIVGVLIALPLAAAVPVLEQIWIPDDHPLRGRFRQRPRGSGDPAPSDVPIGPG